MTTCVLAPKERIYVVQDCYSRGCRLSLAELSRRVDDMMDEREWATGLHKLRVELCAETYAKMYLRRLK